MQERIIGIDQIGVPVTLNLNKKATHQTFAGGCCSLIAICLILAVLVSQVMQVFVNLNYSETVEISYLRYGDGHGPYEISTDDVIPAVQMYTFEYNNQTLDLS